MTGMPAARVTSNHSVRVAVVIGTRPEAIKMAPLVQELKKREGIFETKLIVTAQHRQLLDQVLDVFDIEADIDLDLMQQNQSLVSLAARVSTQIDAVFEAERPDIVLVQGDTTTAFAASFAAFTRRIPVGHVEAGLRSYDMANPFPEEANRRLTAVVSDIHFAPTWLSRDNLLREGIPPERIVVTGNTIVDALEQLMRQPPRAKIARLNGERVLLVTSHRRESWGQDLENICEALRELIARFADVMIVFPVHPNPNVRKTVTGLLAGCERVQLLDPVDYVSFVQWLKAAYLILTDSGGVQEEAPSFRKPVLVLRRTTERPEAARAGLAKIVGTSPAAIVEEATRLLVDRAAYAAMTSGNNPFGDGRAAERICHALERWGAGRRPLLPSAVEFHPDDLRIPA